jgi:exodeoxyribonuclease VII small subunit
MSKSITYKQAFEELQQIVAKIEGGQIGIDELSKQVKKASELLQICRAKLTDTEEDIQKILSALTAEKKEEEK